MGITHMGPVKGRSESHTGVWIMGITHRGPANDKWESHTGVRLLADEIDTQGSGQ